MEHNPECGLLSELEHYLHRQSSEKAHFLSNKSEASPIGYKHYRKKKKKGKNPNKNLENNVLQNTKKLRSY